MKTRTTRQGDVGLILIALIAIGVTRTAHAAPKPDRPESQKYRQLQDASDKYRARIVKATSAVLKKEGYSQKQIQGAFGSGARTSSPNHDLFGGQDVPYSTLGLDPTKVADVQKARRIAQQISKSLGGKYFAQDELPLPGPTLTKKQRDTLYYKGKLNSPKYPLTRNQRASGPHIHIQRLRSMTRKEWTALRKAVLAETLREVDDLDTDELIKEQARREAFAQQPSNATGWKCNYSGTTHGSPDGCADPDQGGVWVNDEGDELAPKTAPAPPSNGPLSLPPATKAMKRRLTPRK